MNIKNLVGSFACIVVVGVMLFALVLVNMSWQNVRPGFVGIVFDKANHQLTARQLEPGWAFINPFTQAIREYPITIRTYAMLQKQGESGTKSDDSIKVQSNEGQQINLDIILQYQVIKEEAAALYQDWGGAPIESVQEGVVRQYARAHVPQIASKFSWEEITSSKRNEIVEELSTILARDFRGRHIQLVSFGIREVHLPESLQQSLIAKIQAQQAAERQEYELKQAEVKAKQAVTEATGLANATKAQAEGDAAAILVRAKAQAEANAALAKSLSPQLIRYQEVQRWNGELPKLTGGAVPMLNFDSFKD